MALKYFFNYLFILNISIFWVNSNCSQTLQMNASSFSDLLGCQTSSHLTGKLLEKMEQFHNSLPHTNNLGPYFGATRLLVAVDHDLV